MPRHLASAVLLVLIHEAASAQQGAVMRKEELRETAVKSSGAKFLDNHTGAGSWAERRAGFSLDWGQHLQKPGARIKGGIQVHEELWPDMFPNAERIAIENKRKALRISDPFAAEVMDLLEGHLEQVCKRRDAGREAGHLKNGILMEGAKAEEGLTSDEEHERALQTSYYTSTAQLRQNHRDLSRLTFELNSEDKYDDEGFLIPAISPIETIRWVQHAKYIQDDINHRKNKEARLKKEAMMHPELLEVNKTEEAEWQAKFKAWSKRANDYYHQQLKHGGIYGFWAEDRPHELRLDPENMKVYSWSTYQLRFPFENTWGTETRWKKLPMAPKKVKYNKAGKPDVAGRIAALLDENDEPLSFVHDGKMHWFQGQIPTDPLEIMKVTRPKDYQSIMRKKRYDEMHGKEEKWTAMFNMTDTVLDYVDRFKKGVKAEKHHIRDLFLGLRNGIENTLHLPPLRKKGPGFINVNSQGQMITYFSAEISKVTLRQVLKRIENVTTSPYEAVNVHHGPHQINKKENLDKFLNQLHFLPYRDNTLTLSQADHWLVKKVLRQRGLPPNYYVGPPFLHPDYTKFGREDALKRAEKVRRREQRARTMARHENLKVIHAAGVATPEQHEELSGANAIHDELHALIEREKKKQRVKIIQAQKAQRELRKQGKTPEAASLAQTGNKVWRDLKGDAEVKASHKKGSTELRIRFKNGYGEFGAGDEDSDTKPKDKPQDKPQDEPELSADEREMAAEDGKAVDEADTHQDQKVKTAATQKSQDEEKTRTKDSIEVAKSQPLREKASHSAKETSSSHSEQKHKTKAKVKLYSDALKEKYHGKKSEFDRSNYSEEEHDRRHALLNKTWLESQEFREQQREALIKAIHTKNPSKEDPNNVYPMKVVSGYVNGEWTGPQAKELTAKEKTEAINKGKAKGKAKGTDVAEEPAPRKSHVKSRRLLVKEKDGTIHVERDAIATPGHPVPTEDTEWATIDRGIPLDELVDEDDEEEDDTDDNQDNGVSALQLSSFIWTKKGIQALTERHLAEKLGNPKEGAEVTQDQKKTMESAGKWQEAIAAGAIEDHAGLDSASLIVRKNVKFEYEWSSNGVDILDSLGYTASFGNPEGGDPVTDKQMRKIKAMGKWIEALNSGAIISKATPLKQEF